LTVGRHLDVARRREIAPGPVPVRPGAVRAGGVRKVQCDRRGKERLVGIVSRRDVIEPLILETEEAS